MQNKDCFYQFLTDRWINLQRRCLILALLWWVIEYLWEMKTQTNAVPEIHNQREICKVSVLFCLCVRVRIPSALFSDLKCLIINSYEGMIDLFYMSSKMLWDREMCHECHHWSMCFLILVQQFCPRNEGVLGKFLVCDWFWWVAWSSLMEYPIRSTSQTHVFLQIHAVTARNIEHLIESEHARLCVFLALGKMQKHFSRR